MNRSRIALTLALGAMMTLLAVLAMGCNSTVPADAKVLPATPAGAPATSAGAKDQTRGALAQKSTVPAAKLNFFSTSGSKIVDSTGKEVRITGVNWFGMETGTFAPHGVWARNWEEMLDQIADLGFNTIRLPYSNQLFDPSSKAGVGEGIDFKMNPDLQGLTGIQVMDKIVEGAGKRGLKVILDRHRPDVNAQSKLWYTAKYPEERWISDWVMLAQRYKGNDTVIGADLHNEPAGDSTWGSGDPKTDWRLAAERAGNAIQAVNSDWLIIVEGIEKADNNKDWYWMGGNLVDAAKNPVRLNVPNKLVYSPHDYGPEVYMQGWFKDPSFPANLPGVWDAHWGYLAEQGTAPVLLGEFGGNSVGIDLGGVWQRTLVQYLKDRGMSYTFWAFNANSGDTGGILTNDWTTVNQDKVALLATYQEEKMSVGNPSQVDTSVGPRPIAARADVPPIPEGEAAPQPGPNDPTVKVSFQSGKTDSQTNNPSLKIKIANVGTVPVALGDLEVRYWFNANNPDGKGQTLDVDWASNSKDGLESKFVKAGPRLDYLGLMFKDRNKMLAPNDTVDIVARIHKDDWSQYNQDEAYSYSDSPEQQEWKRITAYLAGKLNWGTEPTLK